MVVNFAVSDPCNYCLLYIFQKDDTVVLNRDHLIQTAKDKALELAHGYEPPAYRDDLKLPGAGGRTALSMALKGFKMQGKISEHDMKIGEKLAYVLTGGDKAGLTKSVDEQYIPIVNIAVDDINLVNLTSNTIPSLVIKLLNPLPAQVIELDEKGFFNIIKKIKLFNNSQNLDAKFWVQKLLLRKSLRSLKY